MIAFGAGLSDTLDLIGRSQGSCSCGSRLFDSTAVMILVSRKRGATCEGFLAVRIRAFIWSFPGVCSPMAS